MSAQSTPGPLASRQGTEQETYAGPWIVSHEGSPVIKRELRFVEDGAPAGWELLSGDTSQLEALIARAPDLAAELADTERMRVEACDHADKLAAENEALRRERQAMLVALDAIANMEVNETTDHRQLSALVIAIAKQSRAGVI